MLLRAPDAFWRWADEVIVSVYPATRRLIARLQGEAARRAAAHGVKLVFRSHDRFQAVVRERPNDDEEAVRQAYGACTFKRYTHSVRDGRLYRCAPSVNLIRSRSEPDPSDSLDLLDGGPVVGRLAAFLRSPYPLAACAHCHGSDGADFPHTLAPLQRSAAT
jgi:hypothetical protein